MESKKKGDFYTGHGVKKRISIVFEKSDLEKLYTIYQRDGIPVISQIVKATKDYIQQHL